MKHEDLTEKVIGIFYSVYNDLGHGFLESIYQKAFVLHLCKHGLALKSRRRFEWFISEWILVIFVLI